MGSKSVTCPVCSRNVLEKDINAHLDNNCANAESLKQNSIAGPSNVTQKQAKLAVPGVAPIFDRQSRNPTATQGPQRSQSTHLNHIQKRSLPDISNLNDAQRSAKRTKSSTTTTRLASAAPLAERLRPRTLEEFIGQSHLTSPDSALMCLMQRRTTGNIILWGPPGCGKTTLARLLAKHTDAVFKELSATDSGIADVRAVAEEAKGALTLTGRRTVLFLDEVHRFNRAQQDIFLPFIEQGIVQLIGATTENPSFKLTGALLSRCRVFVLERLMDADMKEIITNAVERYSRDENGIAVHASGFNAVYQGSSTQSRSSLLNQSSAHIPSSPSISPSPLLTSSPSLTQSSSKTNNIPQISQDTSDKAPFPQYPQLTTKILDTIVSLSTGDARTALSLVELVLLAPSTTAPTQLLASLRKSVSTSYDRTGDDRYDMISALHKSVRGSQGSAAMYWLARMLGAGEDPMYIARRMVVCASEDIGLADNQALPLAIATLQACQTIGMPECRINLAHLVAYLSEAPKSTRAYAAYKRAEEAAKADPTLPVPLMVRNAPTGLMKQLGYGDHYQYNPDYIHPVTNEYLPSSLRDEVFLKLPDDLSDKLWDEEALRRWESKENGGKPWEGRGDTGISTRSSRSPVPSSKSPEEFRIEED